MFRAKSVTCENLEDRIKVIVDLGDETLSFIVSDLRVSSEESDLVFKKFSQEKVEAMLDGIKKSLGL